MKRLIILITIFYFAMVSCEKDSGTGLEIYLLTDFQKKSQSFEIISGSEKLSKNPIISYTDIIWYDSTDHSFQVDDSKARELNNKNWNGQGTAFSVTINKNVIYSGYFMPGYSSMSLDWISIDPLNINSNFRVTLGYPVDLLQLANRDPRNDSRIIKLLVDDNKLKQ